jgi:UDP-hydrolysing UDP-N-acetyl-D-glucosamine 2-epimerase
VTARVLVVTGTRAEFGLLEPVMRAVDAHADLELRVAATGAHLLAPARTIEEVRERVRIDAVVEMQRPGETSRTDDARALGRGILGFADAIEALHPAWVVVLGDRIEALAAASAASVGGIPVAHLHGGDRAEGVADEAMRHAVTKLAHLHLPATPASAERIIRMGENPELVCAIGSTAIDALASVAPMADDEFAECGSPEALFLMHPIGRDDEAERRAAGAALSALSGRRTLALHPNHDPGRLGIIAAIRDAGVLESQHLARDRFLALLRRLAGSGGLLVGNSSAGLIEAAALRLPAVNIGERQGGRERASNVVDAEETRESAAAAIERALAIERDAIEHPYGDGRAGERAAERIAAVSRTGDLTRVVRKRNSY